MDFAIAGVTVCILLLNVLELQVREYLLRRLQVFRESLDGFLHQLFGALDRAVDFRADELHRERRPRHCIGPFAQGELDPCGGIAGVEDVGVDDLVEVARVVLVELLPGDLGLRLAVPLQKVTTITSMLSVAFIRPGISYVTAYVMNLGILGIWIGIFADLLMRLILTGARFRSGKWMTKKI